MFWLRLGSWGCLYSRVGICVGPGVVGVMVVFDEVVWVVWVVVVGLPTCC